MPYSIEVGAKLKKKDAPDYIVTIVEMLELEGELPHARAQISLRGSELGVRLYSTAALADTRLFLPVSTD
jgi:hypothetical protein